ncbi:3D-(3,5/4)-trihydroxycyclohexane-1,2-dione acylhydrolase (decyclizing) [Sinanaerobacter chloroacetimidivorans]|jgi:3D-(3,5/4)-trihydroxycyclohexane-1,2-dione acylhydrolase (decyclizing)|uniref:3D-(3,5/4)-trihydroxycyclohexane-1,2-dione hydrolase n=1 Tax=Sinanaerobacter chloroacetimidivorans TaxID=2818044 RepID=A0A8J7W5C1_9FIRM|nr:3D-(3,5/4)-trihydroxycyclohexane-1,2-dione acylhydrolase (decyclizing) [Sinanaerobacter chloroacetimidivorans]MBR0600561.1 3D-(3,5/4)-trihydroxycyclohexane-1,2-dione acylhydrolase (decyclizing) [Sinanaerobacter chloroacetimidivorans]
MTTQRMTMAQALVKFLDNQYVSFDGVETKFVEGIFTIFGHGIVLGLGQALDEDPGQLKVLQGRNEQGMAHVATAFGKQNNRRKIIACASSIGPGAANMVTAAATATVNNLPLLLLPGDTFATRQPDPVLQQIEQPFSMTITTNDAFKPVCKYWDRVSRPEQLMSAMINAMRVLTDPAETGAVCVAIPQDVQGESFDYPDYFFKKRVHKITRPTPVSDELEDVIQAIMNSKHPMVICGGGVRYSEAGETLEQFCETFNIPFGETQGGKSACKSSSPYCLGGMGVTGNLAANTIAEKADLIIAVGTRLSDFTTGSKALFQNPDVKFISINASRFQAYKVDSIKAVGDAKATLIGLTAALQEKGYKSAYQNEIKEAKAAWDKEMKWFAEYAYDENFKPIVESREPKSIDEFIALTGGTITQTSALCLIRETIDKDAIIVGASGSLPGCLQRMWATDKRDSYHMEYGYSCMGYEVAASLGAKLASPDQEVYAMTGDGSYLMLHTELVTSLQEGKKINVLLFDNCGFGCINNLEMSNGVGNLATEFRYRDEDNQLLGGLMPIDFAKSAAGYGVKTYTAKTLEELKVALEDAKKQTVSTLIDIKVLPKTMTEGYKSWWHCGIASTSAKDSIKIAYESKEANLKKARLY